MRRDRQAGQRWRELLIETRMSIAAVKPAVDWKVTFRPILNRSLSLSLCQTDFGELLRSRCDHNHGIVNY